MTYADAGLEVWSDVAPAAELRAALPAALQLGRLGRVVTWARCWSRRRSATSPGEAGFGDASVAWRS